MRICECTGPKESPLHLSHLSRGAALQLSRCRCSRLREAESVLQPYRRPVGSRVQVTIHKPTINRENKKVKVTVMVTRPFRSTTTEKYKNNIAVT